MKLAAIFSDGMVLQRNVCNKIFGTSDTRERINVSIDGINVSKVVDSGKWCITLPEHEAGGPFDMIVTSSEADNSKSQLNSKIDESGNATSEMNPQDSRVVIKDVLYGEVWFDGGQSNMEFELQNCQGGMDEIEKADHPDIRFFKAIKAPVVDDAFLKEEEELKWHDHKTGDISAVAYFFAVKLQKTLGVPIGLIDCYQGGTSITCWIERGRLEKIPEAAEYLESYDSTVASQTEEEYEKKVAEFEKINEIYNSKVEDLKQKEPGIEQEEIVRRLGEGLWPPPLGTTSLFRPCGLVETMFERITPYNVRGVIYYQGEEDTSWNFNYMKQTGKNIRYKVLMKELIQQYRDMFDDVNLPIAIAQLPMYLSPIDEDLRDWAYLREGQEAAINETENTYLVSLLDCGEYSNIHPLDKKTPGERYALTLLDGCYSSPDFRDGNNISGARDMIFSGADFQEECITISFENTYGRIYAGENGLIDIRKELESSSAGQTESQAVTLQTVDSEKTADTFSEHIYGFEVSSDGERWIVPDAAIRGENILLNINPEKLSSAGITSISDIRFIRYGFFNYGKVNLYNGKGMPLRQINYVRNAK